MKKIVAIVISLFFISQEAAAQNFVGKYESLDGKIRHVFFKSGDYFGSSISNGRPDVVQGVFKTGTGICSNPQTKQNGNLLLFYRDITCCLRAEKISDKYALSFVATSFPMDLSFGVCTNQVIKTHSEK